MAYEVTFSEIYKDKIRLFKKQACFSGMYYYGHPLRIKYLARVYNTLSLDHIKFYVSFLNKMLDKNLFTARILEGEKTQVLFNLKTENLNEVQALCYLTAFRNTDEFPHVIEELFKYKNLSFNKQFKKLQEMYVLMVRGEIKDLHHNCGGHGLIYNYAWNDPKIKIIPINLKTFRAELNNKDIKRVHSFWSGIKSYTPPIKPAKPVKVIKINLADIWKEVEIKQPEKEFKYRIQEIIKEDNLKIYNNYMDYEFDEFGYMNYE